MITDHAPSEYRKPKYDPRQSTVHLCLDCGGRCVDLPRVGVACLLCGSKRYTTCTEAEADQVREERNVQKEIIDLLKRIPRVEYPKELLDARRAAFIELVNKKAGGVAAPPDRQ